MSKKLDSVKQDSKSKKVAPTTVKNQKKSKKSFGKFFKDAKSEFKKVVWPSKKSIINNTIVVLVTLIISGLFIWGLDSLFSFINGIIFT